MAIIQLNSVGYDTTQDLRRLIDKYNENFRQLDWLLNQGKLGKQNISQDFYDTIIESPDVTDAIQKAVEAALASLGTIGIQSLNLNDAYIGVPYSQVLSVPTHEMAVWEMVEGDLPPGIELTETGELTGTPTGPLDENGVPFPIPDDMYKVSSHMFAVRAATSVSEYFGVFYIDLCREPGYGSSGSAVVLEENAFRVLSLPNAYVGSPYEGAILFKYKGFKTEQVIIDYGELPTGLRIDFNNLPTDIPGNASTIFEFSGKPLSIGVFDFRLKIIASNEKGEKKEFSKSYRIETKRDITTYVKKLIVSQGHCVVGYDNGSYVQFDLERDNLGRIISLTEFDTRNQITIEYRN